MAAGSKDLASSVMLRRAGQERSVVLTAAVFALTPVNGAAVVTSPSGRKLGYVVVKDMISQALDATGHGLCQLPVGRCAGRGAGPALQRRWPGQHRGHGGFPMWPAAAVPGRTYAHRLLYNDKRAAANNQSFAFSTPAAGLGLRRAIVLMGPRTCSASEQVINGLLGAGIEVLAVGDTTCGKPVASCGLLRRIWPTRAPAPALRPSRCRW
jgi:carboxyl-terminal processing protease